MNGVDAEQGLNTIMWKVLNNQNINMGDNYFLSGGNSTNFCIFKDRDESFFGISIDWDQFILKGSKAQIFNHCFYKSNLAPTADLT